MSDNLLKSTLDTVNTINTVNNIMTGGASESNNQNNAGEAVASKGTIGLLERFGVLTEILTEVKESIMDKCIVLCSTILYISVYPVIPFFFFFVFSVATIKYIFWKFRKL